jgi:hypothetical protein
MVLSIAKNALAAPVPMCSEDGQSIAAPFPLLPTKNGELRAERRCETQDFQLGKAPPPERDHQKRAGETFERSVPVQWKTAKLHGQKLPAPRAEKQPGRSGFVDSLFRPPRAS